MLFSLVFQNNFGFSILQEISKFTQNIIICGCLLLQIFLWQKYPIAIYIIKNYVYIFTLFDVFILLCGFSLEFSFLEVNFCASVILKILPIIGLVFNLLLIAMAIYNNYQEQNESQKNGALIYENDNLGAIIDKYASSLRKMRKYYLIFIVYFTLSYFVDVYFKFSNIRYDDAIYSSNSNSSNLNGNSSLDNSFKKGSMNKNIYSRRQAASYIFGRIMPAVDYFEGNFTLRSYNKENNQTDFLFEKDFASLISNLSSNNNNNNNRILNEDRNRSSSGQGKSFSSNNDDPYKNKKKNSNFSVFITRYISACEYYKDLGDKYSFKELLVCFISFVFRDIGPHIYIFISLFIYKPESLSRSSSFIEI